MRSMRTTVFALGLIAACGAASAGTLKGKFTYTLSQNSNITASGGIYNGDVKTVQFHWTRTDAPGAGVDNTVPITFDTYCVDLAQNVSSGNTYTYNVLSLTDAGYTPAQQSMLRQLWTSYKPGADTANESAALQLAIWEVIYDTNNNLSTGTFKVNSTSTQRTAAQALITNAANALSNPAPGGAPILRELVVLRSSSAQDQITELPPTVPTPGAAALAVAGLLMAAPRRKARA